MSLNCEKIVKKEEEKEEETSCKSLKELISQTVFEKKAGHVMFFGSPETC